MIGSPIYLVSACGSGEEFVAAFRRYADKGGIFIPIAEPLPANRRGRFAMTLKDGSVMIEGEAEIVASSKSPSPLYGRVGMTVKFVEPDDTSKTVLGELDRARLAPKASAPSIPPRPTEVPAAPRPVVPAIAGRIDAANALAESVAIGDQSVLKDLGPPKAGPKFVIPSIPSSPRAKTPSSFPIVEARTPTTPPPLVGPTMSPSDSIPTAVPAPSAMPAPPAGMRARTASVAPLITSKDTQPVAVAPPPKATMERRPDRSASLPALEDLKVGQTQAVGVVPPPSQMFAAKNLFEDSSGYDTDTNRAAPITGEESADNKPVDPPAPATIAMAAVVPGTVPPPFAPRTQMHLAMQAAPELANDTEDALAPAPVARVDSRPLTPTALHTAPPPVAAGGTVAMTSTMPDVTLDSAIGSIESPAGFDSMDVPIELDESADSMSGPMTAVTPAAPITPAMSLADLVKSASKTKSARADANPTIRGTLAPQKTPTSSKPAIAKPMTPIEAPHSAGMMGLPVVKPAVVPATPPVKFPVAIENDEPTDLSEIPPRDSAAAIDDDIDQPTAQHTPISPIGIPLGSATPTSITSPPMPAGLVSGARPVVEEPTPSGDWTMTPDGPVEVKTRAATPPPASANEEAGDWTITPDMPAPQGYDTPNVPKPDAEIVVAPKPAARPAPKPPTKTKAFQAVDLAPPNAHAAEPKVQIDPTLMEPLPVMPVDEPEPLDDAPIPPPRPGTGNPAPMFVPAAFEPTATASGNMPASMELSQVGAMAYAPPPMMQQMGQMHPPPPMGPPPLVSMQAQHGQVPFGPPTPLPFAPPQEMQPPLFAPSSTGSNTAYPGDANATHASASASMPPIGDRTSVLQIKRRKRMIVIAVVAIAILAVAAVAFIVITSKKSASVGSGSSVVGSGSAAAITPPSKTGSADGSDGSAAATPPTTPADAATTIADGSGGSGSAEPAVKPAGTCTIEVTSIPAGADIYADNKKIGTAPQSLELPCGKATEIELRKGGFNDTSRKVTPTADGAKIKIGLAHPMLSIRVTSVPSNANIAVNGKAINAATPSIVKLPAMEPATITLTRDGFAAGSEKVTPKSANQSVHIVLKKKK